MPVFNKKPKGIEYLISQDWDCSQSTKNTYLNAYYQTKRCLELQHQRKFGDIFDILKHREYVMDWLNDYYKGKSSSKKSKLCAYIRFLKDRPTEKENLEFYEKEWEKIKGDMREEYKSLSDKKKSNWVRFSKLKKYYLQQLNKCKKSAPIKNAKSFSDLNQSQYRLLEGTLLLSLWLSKPLITPPRRCGSWASMRVIKLIKNDPKCKEILQRKDGTFQNENERENYLVLNRNKVEMIQFNKYKCSAYNSHGTTNFYNQYTNKNLQWILNKWIKLRPSSEFLFPKKSKVEEHWEQEYFTKMIKKHIKYAFPNKNISSSMLRNIIITYYNKHHIFASQLSNWSRLCGHGIKCNIEHYTHDFEEEQEEN